MIRNIIAINEEKCNGCGLCAQACHEGAIGMVGGKAKLLREDYCDGLGDCLPACPMGAIQFEQREAPAYDEAAVKAARAAKHSDESRTLPCGCPGTQARRIARTGDAGQPAQTASRPAESRLLQWPVQIKLLPITAPYFDGAELLIAADCTAYAFGDFHNRFIRGRVTLIGCPKLDEGDYTEKLNAILINNEIRSMTVVRMQVPCCGGIERAARQALERSEKQIPLKVVILTPDGRIVG